MRFVVSQILEGLFAIHRKGFFHRDIKPENLLWKNDLIKIADFGLAKTFTSKPPFTEYIFNKVVSGA